MSLRREGLASGSVGLEADQRTSWTEPDLSSGQLQNLADPEVEMAAIIDLLPPIEDRWRSCGKMFLKGPGQGLTSTREGLTRLDAFKPQTGR